MRSPRPAARISAFMPARRALDRDGGWQRIRAGAASRDRHRVLRHHGGQHLVAQQQTEVDKIGVARAAYFPAITLSGSIGYQSTSLGNLVTWPSFVWSVGATLAETIIDAGRRKGVTEQAWANYQGTVANYRQAALIAFQEVEDNLSMLRLLSQELERLDAAVSSSQRYLTLANDRYKLGIDSFLNVIIAQTTLLNNQRTTVNLRAKQMTATVQLVKALGGGWDASLIPSPNGAAHQSEPLLPSDR